MTHHGVQSRWSLGVVVSGVAALGVSLAACGGDNVGKLAPPTGGAAASGTAGGAGTAGDRGGSAGAAGSGTSDAGANGGSGGGGSGSGGVAGAAGSADIDAAEPGDGAAPAMQCVFHTDPPVADSGPSLADAEGGSSEDARDLDAEVLDAAETGVRADAGDGGARAGDAGPATSITVLTSPFVGPYLADSAGRTLYTYGGDLAGDCNYAPISLCELDCLIAWPLFDAGARTLPPSLNGAAFGTIQRTDGSFQTTYFGWPLYYYKSDTAPGMFTGQAKAKTWHAATVIPVGVVILKGASAIKYLADGAGRTLYMFDVDTRGSATSDPVSTCNGDCLVDHPIFQRNRLSVVSSLEPTDFTVFVRSEGAQQLAYKGAPLYYSAADARSGDLNGATSESWSIVVP